MGLTRLDALGSLRLSLGFDSTAADVDAALRVIPPAVAQLRDRGLAA
jgi:cysteine desulfurase